MDPHGRAGHARADPQALRRLRDAAEHRPHERALALRVDPRVEVVGDQREREARLLGAARVLDERARTELLARELVAELHHRPLAAPSVVRPGAGGVRRPRRAMRMRSSMRK